MKRAASLGAAVLLAGIVSCNNSDTGQGPSATVSPSPSPTPTPAPSPSASPTVARCTLPDNPECGAPEGPSGVFGCCRGESVRQFENQVDEAILIFKAQRPDLFNGDVALDQRAYVQGVAEVMNSRFGLCAKQGGPPDELAVKNSNSFNEQYDIQFGSGAIRLNGYQVTCRPARF